MSCDVSQLEFSIHTKLLFVNEHKMTIYVPFGFNLFSNIWINIFHWWNKRKPKYPHFLAVCTKFDTFYFQIFCLIKKKSAIRGKLSFLILPLGPVITLPQKVAAAWYFETTH
jgi:hypothetical protein